MFLTSAVRTVRSCLAVCPWQQGRTSELVGWTLSKEAVTIEVNFSNTVRVSMIGERAEPLAARGNNWRLCYQAIFNQFSKIIIFNALDVVFAKYSYYIHQLNTFLFKICD